MGELRSTEMLLRYKQHLQNVKNDTSCPLCSLPSLYSFSLWRIVANQFPYNMIATTHDMIMPKRHCHEDQLTVDELAELRTIKRTFINTQYEFINESVSKTSSIPAHYHLHLMVARIDIK